MNPLELSEALRKTDVSDRAELNHLAQALASISKDSVDEAVRLWADDSDLATKAAYLLGRIGDAAIGPLLDMKRDYTPLQQVWRIKRIVNEQLQRQEEIVAELEGLLEDKREISYPVEPSSIEEPPADERICDVAYILLRIMLYPQADPDQHQFDAHFFRDMEFEDRDREIEKYLSEGSWTDFNEADMDNL